jgi:hypothetical protein
MLRILTPPSGYHLTTVSRVREELRLGDEPQDAVIKDWIGDASRSISDYCERVFGRQLVEERMDLRDHGESVIRLRMMPAVVEQVTFAGQALSDTDWYYNDEGGLCRLVDGEPVPWPWRYLTVRYRSGWRLPGEAERDLPENVEAACLQLVASRYHGGGRDPRLRSETVEGVGSTSWTDYRAGAGGMPQNIAEKLARYVRYTVA